MRALTLKLRELKLDRATVAHTVLKELNLTREDLRLLEAALAEHGMKIITVTGRRTARSRQKVAVDLVVRDEETAGLLGEKLQQLSLLGQGRRHLGIAPTAARWVVRAQNRNRRSADGRIIPGACPDGQYDIYNDDGTVTTVQLEASMGALSGQRLLDKVHSYGRGPQWWITPSTAHAQSVRQAMQEVWPNQTGSRVIVVQWTGLDMQGQ